jgi:hypothetical protein
MLRLLETSLLTYILPSEQRRLPNLSRIRSVEANSITLEFKDEKLEKEYNVFINNVHSKYVQLLIFFRIFTHFGLWAVLEH